MLTRSVRDTVVAAIEEVSGERVPDNADERSLEEFEIDSLGLIEVGMIVEEAFDIVVDPEAFDGVETFGAAVAAFERLVREQRSGDGA